MTPAQLRLKNRKLFEQFWAAYPKKVAINEAERAFTEAIESGASPDHLIQKARAYSLNVDPEKLEYVPAPASWIRQGRYEDNDLFTDRRAAELNWLRKCWETCDVRAVEDKFGIRYRKPPLPDEVQGADAARVWHREQARAWIAEQRSRLE
ncbi:hypothetical protein J4U01_gp064 [Mycobacterium phage Kumao]|uniref:Uncharacterized protein n=1 Tax=Mycobacterium phage Kumao TaxID=2041344 RepID=A0A2D1GPT0_9CAUD|nr:hypothetical protein J4U01_gp064 [Mycobacterium phage Kumao]ATN94027.1 hypothetical protein SEA_KUMAO_64 [Mycobacterium phage Kumao]